MRMRMRIPLSLNVIALCFTLKTLCIKEIIVITFLSRSFLNMQMLSINWLKFPLRIEEWRYLSSKILFWKWGLDKYALNGVNPVFGLLSSWHWHATRFLPPLLLQQLELKDGVVLNKLFGAWPMRHPSHWHWVKFKLHEDPQTKSLHAFRLWCAMKFDRVWLNKV